MKVVSIIPARGGSKGVPRKNVRLLAKKPLIAYSIEGSLNSKLINRTIVSTDDKEIAEISRKYGAEVIIRPKELAKDDTPTEPVMQHVIKELEKENYIPDLIVLLQPTSPLREKDDIDNAIKKLIETKADSLLSVCKFPYFLWKRKGRFAESINYNIKKRPFHQDLKQYKENGSIYITKREVLLKENCRLGKKIALYEMSFLNSFEIDEEFDFWIVSRILFSKNS